MRLYIAGLYTSNFDLAGGIYLPSSEGAKRLRENVSWFLESYHYIHKGKYVERMRRDKVRIFLDSGAFSAFSLGAVIDIAAYAEFVKEHQDIIEMASVLDAIGDAEGTYKNQVELERRGAEVLPCFHYGEPWDICEYYVRNYEYITIGGMVPIPNAKLEPWLDELWDRVLTDKDGYARTKVHGFGQTSGKLMLKYPWYSVDSSSWIQMAAHGNIILPELFTSIAVSERSPNRKQFGAHYDTMPEESKAYIRALLEFYGLTLEEVREGHRSRWALNCFTFDLVGKRLGDDHWRKPFKLTQGRLF